MNRLINGHRNGFTIIELMIVLIIIAILVALAYPAYTDYIRKAKRGEAQQLLLNWAIDQEIWRSNNPTYNGLDADTVGNIIPDDENEYYDFDYAVAPDATTYTLRATALGDQAKDRARNGESCARLLLDWNSVKRPAPCWE